MLRDIYISIVLIIILLSADALAFSGVMAAANSLFGAEWISWKSICFNARISGAIAFICLALSYMEFSQVRSEIHTGGERG